MILIFGALLAVYVFCRAILPLKLKWGWKLLLAALLAVAAFKFHLLHLFGGPMFFSPVLPENVLLAAAWLFSVLFLFFFLLGIYMRREYKDFVLHLTSVHILMTVLLFLLGLYGLLGMGWHACFLLTAMSGTVLVLWLSLMLSRYPSHASALLEHWGILSMDIYILGDIIKIPFRIALWNKLHLYTPTFVICTIVAIVLSVWVSECLIRKSSCLSFLILGIRK